MPLADVRFALRSLARRPLVSVTVTATLAVALAFNVASASVLSALLQHPFPYSGLDALVLVRDARPREGVHQGRAIAAADFYDLRQSVAAFASLAAFRSAPVVITSAGQDPEYLEATAVSANFFTMLGISPVVGQLWATDADQPGHDDVVLLSRRLWHSRFGGDRSVIGGRVSLNGRPATVVGIVRDEECYPAGVDAWMPLVLSPAEQKERSAQRLNGIARLAPGASIEVARAQLESASMHLAAVYPLTNRGRAFDLLPLRREQYEFTAALFGFVQVAALLVLALAIVNVTNLLVARTMDRGQELAVRSMLGASRREVATLILIETAILTVGATGLGTAAARPSLVAIRASLPEGIARWINGWSAMRIDSTALAVSAVLGIVTTLTIGGIAAARASASTTSWWSGARVTRRRRWASRTVVASEIALAAVLLLCAAVVVEGFGRVATTFGGLSPDRLLRFTLTTPPWRYADDGHVSAFHTRLLEELGALPAVEAAALVRNEPASNVPNAILPLRRLDAPPPSPSDAPRADVQTVSPAAFDVLRVATISGRRFLATDTAQAARVAIVSREAARRFWPDRDPLGTLVHLGADPAAVRIVGVVADSKLNWYDVELRPVVYVPDAQAPARTVAVLVRTRIEPTAVAPQIRAVVQRLDSLQPIAGVEALSTTIADSLSPIRVIERLLLTGAAAAAALAALGVFGILAQSVGQRRHEFGVRFAVGATPRSIATLVVRDAASTAAIGLAAGLALAVPAVRLARGWLLGVAALNASVVLLVAACMSIVVIGAALVPARRAARVDVATLLRFE
jgi:putative ABC transport system permease protein